MISFSYATVSLLHVHSLHPPALASPGFDLKNKSFQSFIDKFNYLIGFFDNN